jgi:hypothetical protein
MAATVRIDDIVESLEMQFDELSNFLDLETGEVHTIEGQLLREAEELDEGEEPQMPEWQKSVFEIAKLIAVDEGERFKRLPGKFEIEDWEIMREFVDSVESNRIREDLERAIHGKGAFRYFKDTIHRHKVEKDWYAFRDAALRDIAIEWCEQHKIPWK